MTELEIMQRAKMYMDKLAQGIDPISGQEVPNDSVLNNVRLARCFFYVSGILDQVIANGGRVISGEKNFYITQEEISRLQLSQEALRITQLADRITDGVNDPARKRLKATTITNWLTEKGFLEKRVDEAGKSKRQPTAAGEQLGLYVREMQGKTGSFQAVYYGANAQRFILDHLMDILREEKQRNR